MLEVLENVPNSFTDGVIIDDEYPLQTGTKLVIILREYYIYELVTIVPMKILPVKINLFPVQCLHDIYRILNVISYEITFLKNLIDGLFTVAVAELLDIDEEALTKALQSNTHKVNGKINYCFGLFKNLG